jgi:ribonuclease-3
LTRRPDLGVGSYPSTLPEILSKDLRSRVFNRISSTGPKYEFEDPANLTPDGEKYVLKNSSAYNNGFICSLENLGDSVLGLVVTSLILDMYPGLRAGPSTVRKYPCHLNKLL